jgi:ABC-type transport system involved in multi-copper enzyme maturation permease subunit
VIALMGADAVALYTLRELLRRKVLYFLVGGGALLVLAIGILAAVARSSQFVGGGSNVDFSGLVLIQMSSIVSFFAWIAAIAISVTLISQDLDSGTAVSVFAKPVSRLAYALGKLGAAVAAMLVIVVVLGVGTQAVVAVTGGGHEAPLLKTFVLISANQLTQMLVILILTVLMNNIVAAFVGVFIIQATKVVGWLFLVTTQLATTSGLTFDPNSGGFLAFRYIVTGVYWMVPRYLDSDLQREVFQRAAQGSQSSGFNPNAINASGPTDVIYWAVYTVLLIALLYWALRRREV